MFISVLEISIYIRNSLSLKDKRRVLSSLKMNIKNKFNVSICESAYLDDHKLSKLAIVIVNNSLVVNEREFSKIENLLYQNKNFEISDINSYQIM